MDYKVRDFEVLGDRTTDDRVGMREAPGATRATESIHMPAGECRLVDTTAAPAPTLPLRATRPPAAGVTARLRAKRKISLIRAKPRSRATPIAATPAMACAFASPGACRF
ncbi:MULTISPECIES: hypothetical protein [Azotobacter]|uniref:hypothetical protein n=1 Tax=Azotobacter TaxID=352 RepID=UPI0005A0C627|nr:hypothetical protein [Azotobacter vinelandii]WKN21949.1 hypothetical protein AVAEIV_005083 [Azotobacter vinelandii]GLK57852.1 hypothetical protein GCM10017624_00090 [Azotobacter vinelandii]